jgi:hypothetical protein
VFVFVRLLKSDADDFGELLLCHPDPQPPFPDTAGDAKIDDPAELR